MVWYGWLVSLKHINDSQHLKNQLTKFKTSCWCLIGLTGSVARPGDCCPCLDSSPGFWRYWRDSLGWRRREQSRRPCQPALCAARSTRKVALRDWQQRRSSTRSLRSSGKMRSRWLDRRKKTKNLSPLPKKEINENRTEKWSYLVYSLRESRRPTRDSERPR